MVSKGFFAGPSSFLKNSTTFLKFDKFISKMSLWMGRETGRLKFHWCIYIVK